MAEQRRENSLLVSLKELRNIEEDRLKEEEQAVRAKIEAENRAREESIRRAKEAAEAKIREAEDKARREREEKERQIREEQLRLQEAERRARVEAQAKLEEARIAAEARIRVSKQTPWRLIIGISLVVMTLAGVTLGVIINKHREEKAALQRANEEREAAERKRREDLVAQNAREAAALQKKLDELSGKLATATSEVDKAKIRQEMEETRRVHRPRKSAAAKGDGPIDTETKDPLGSIPGLN